ncbi:DUF6725 family protein [Bifidobacterium simiarum]|uniref:DUF6725 family protein n=1 Tax=Bifidobacterium simiarum TaxID=2045441 RepID=UPI001BDC814A|nr:DUF6725 family protein [Bifidobacterium simiarum]MBT1165710.1 hypothetical protein [Bifidobacterium simiarum]
MRLPEHIPTGARIVVRCTLGVDEHDRREKYRDVVGHVLGWDGETLTVLRDESANGSRPAEVVTVEAATIVRLKPIPERPKFGGDPISRHDPIQ